MFKDGQSQTVVLLEMCANEEGQSMEIAQQLMLAEREITWGSGKSGWKQYHLFPRCDGEYGELASESSGEAD
jgi:hypothetical protein